MALPDPDVARAWGGRMLVDRDGEQIGTCTEVFTDDATGLPEWATADTDGGTAFVPLVNATETGGQVHVAVPRDAVASAPSVGDRRHLSEDEEERLYRHYGIAFSRADSDSLLPAPETPLPPQAASPPGTSAAQAPPSPAPDLHAGDAESPGPDVRSLGSDVRSPAPTSSDAAAPRRIGPVPTPALLAALGAALVAGLVVVVVVVLRRRRTPPPPPPTRRARLTGNARTAAVTLDARRARLAASAAPWIARGGEVSAAAGERATEQAVAAAARASAAAARASAAARQATELAAAAGESRLAALRARRAGSVDGGSADGGSADGAESQADSAAVTSRMPSVISAVTRFASSRRG